MKRDDREICNGKVRHETKQQARDAALRANARHLDHKGKLHVYECKDCGGWHLTSMAPEVFRAMQREANGDGIATQMFEENGFRPLPIEEDDMARRQFQFWITLNAVARYREFVEDVYRTVRDGELGRILDERLRGAKMLDVIDTENPDEQTRVAELEHRAGHKLFVVLRGYVAGRDLLRWVCEPVGVKSGFAVITVLSAEIAAANFAKGRWKVPEKLAHTIPQLPSATIAAPDAPPLRRIVAAEAKEVSPGVYAAELPPITCTENGYVAVDMSLPGTVLEPDEVEIEVLEPSLGEQLTAAIVAEQEARAEYKQRKALATIAENRLATATKLVEELLQRIQAARE